MSPFAFQLSSMNRPAPIIPAFFEFSLCLSRACLGKISIFIYKWPQRTVFSPAGHRASVRPRRHPRGRGLPLRHSSYLSMCVGLYTENYHLIRQDRLGTSNRNFVGKKDFGRNQAERRFPLTEELGPQPRCESARVIDLQPTRLFARTYSGQYSYKNG